MSSYKVLVDSSVWIEYFKSGKVSKLDRLIEEGFVCINELILTELVPALIKANEQEAADGLFSLENIPLRVDWDVVREYQLINLKNGIKKVGIPDLIILQQVISSKITLYSFDKHFKLMQNLLNFELLSR